MLDGVVRFPAQFAARYRAKGFWEDRSLRDVFDEAFERYGDRIAVIDGERAVSYAQLNEHATRLALNLLDHGLAPADRVVVQLPNSIEFVYLYFALQKLGCIPIMALPTHRYREMSQFAELSGAVACVTPDRSKDFDYGEMVSRIRAANKRVRLGIIFGEAQGESLSLRELIERPCARSKTDLEKIKIDPEDPAVFQLSGGTTGIPKLIPRTHNDYIYNSRLASEVTGVGPDEVFLDVLPLAHNLPLACPGLQGYLLHGGKFVLSNSTRSEDIFALIERRQVTHFAVVPALLIRLINDPSIAKFDLSSLRVIQSGGQRLQPEVRRRAKELIPSVTVQENFGMAEGMLMFVRFDDPEDVRLETVGRPLSPDDEVRLVDENDREVAPGEIGELLARGPYTLRGYFGVPEYNARAFTSDGFYRSGDLMRLHPSGNYIVGGRKKDLIIKAGENIAPVRIEEALHHHPAILHAAVIGIPDEKLGEDIMACVELKPDHTVTEGELKKFCLEQLPALMVPALIRIYPELPKNQTGKVLKNQLKAEFAQSLQKDGSPV